jgi:hypothetical protein
MPGTRTLPGRSAVPKMRHDAHHGNGTSGSAGSVVPHDVRSRETQWITREVHEKLLLVCSATNPTVQVEGVGSVRGLERVALYRRPEDFRG